MVVGWGLKIWKVVWKIQRLPRSGWFSRSILKQESPTRSHFLQTPFTAAQAKCWAQRGAENTQGISPVQDFQFLRTRKLSPAVLPPPCGKPGFSLSATREKGVQLKESKPALPQGRPLSSRGNYVNSLHPSPRLAQSRRSAIQSVSPAPVQRFHHECANEWDGLQSSQLSTVPNTHLSHGVLRVLPAYF